MSTLNGVVNVSPVTSQGVSWEQVKGQQPANPVGEVAKNVFGTDKGSALDKLGGLFGIAQATGGLVNTVINVSASKPTEGKIDPFSVAKKVATVTVGILGVAGKVMGFVSPLVPEPARTVLKVAAFACDKIGLGLGLANIGLSAVHHASAQAAAAA